MNTTKPLSTVVQQNAIVLAAVSSLVTSIVREVSGNEISNAVGGQSLTAELGQILVNQDIVEILKNSN